MHSYHYLFAGASIASEVPMPFLQAAPCAPHRGPRISVSASLPQPSRGRLLKEMGPADGVQWRYYQGDEGMQLDVTGIGRFSVSTDGTDVRCELDSRATGADFEHVVVGTVLNHALQSVGIPILHAGAVVEGGRALAISARSGYGKSTLIASLSRRGYHVLSDDTLPVMRADQDGVVVDSHLPRMKLWEDSLRALGGEPEECEPVFSWMTKRQVHADGQFATPATTGPYPLGALYLLAPTVVEIRTEIRTLAGGEAFAGAIHAMYMRLLLNGRRGEQAFDVATAIANTVPVRVIRYTRSFEALGEIGDALIADFARTELVPA